MAANLDRSAVKSQNEDADRYVVPGFQLRRSGNSFAVDPCAIVASKIFDANLACCHNEAGMAMGNRRMVEQERRLFRIIAGAFIAPHDDEVMTDWDAPPLARIESAALAAIFVAQGPFRSSARRSASAFRLCHRPILRLLGMPGKAAAWDRGWHC